MMGRARFEPRIYVAGYPGMVGSAILRRLKADASADLLARTRGECDMRAPHLRVKNGVLLICELKSSIDKAGIYIFERKARFYEARHQRKAARLIVISPMVDARARKVAERLGIEIYHDSTDVTSLDEN